MLLFGSKHSPGHLGQQWDSKGFFSRRAFSSHSPSFCQFRGRYHSQGPRLLPSQERFEAHILTNPCQPQRLHPSWLLQSGYISTLFSHSATLACQRITNAITHIVHTAYHHDCVNYIDNFGPMTWASPFFH